MFESLIDALTSETAKNIFGVGIILAIMFVGFKETSKGDKCNKGGK